MARGKNTSKSTTYSKEETKTTRRSRSNLKEKSVNQVEDSKEPEPSNGKQIDENALAKEKSTLLNEETISEKDKTKDTIDPTADGMELEDSQISEFSKNRSRSRSRSKSLPKESVMQGSGDESQSDGNLGSTRKGNPKFVNERQDLSSTSRKRDVEKAKRKMRFSDSEPETQDSSSSSSSTEESEQEYRRRKRKSKKRRTKGKYKRGSRKRSRSRSKSRGPKEIEKDEKERKKAI